MSTYWTIHCATHDVDGPQIGRTAGGISVADPLLPPDDGGATLIAFLIAHEYDDLRLIHESAGVWSSYTP